MGKAQKKRLLVPYARRSPSNGLLPAPEILRVAEVTAGSLVLVAAGRRMMARSLVDPATLEAGDEVLVLFAGPSRPVVLGRLWDPAAPARDVRVQGRRISIAADAELTLRCASATIRVARDGNVSVRGERVVTQARRSNRVRGGSVELN